MKDERKFKEVIHTIKGAEKDKDKFCKAARIERQPMSKDCLEQILDHIALYPAKAGGRRQLTKSEERLRSFGRVGQWFQILCFMHIPVFGFFYMLFGR